MKRRAYTLIELMIVLLVMGALSSLALPLYISSAKASRAQTANANAKSVLQAVQSLYVRTGGAAYNHSSINDFSLERELGGSLPLNPCTGGNLLAEDFTLVLSETEASVQPKPGNYCDADALPKQKLGG